MRGKTTRQLQQIILDAWSFDCPNHSGAVEARSILHERGAFIPRQNDRAATIESRSTLEASERAFAKGGSR